MSRNILATPSIDKMYTFNVDFYGSTNFTCPVKFPQSGAMYVRVDSFLKQATGTSNPEEWTSMQMPAFLWPLQNESKTIVLQYQENGQMVNHDALATYQTDGKIVIDCDTETTLGNYFSSTGFSIDFTQ